MVAQVRCFERFLELAERERSLPAGSVLFRMDDPVLSLFLVTAGELRLVRALPDGFQLTLQRAGSTSILAEASLFADRYHCDALAAEASMVRAVPITRAVLESDRALASALLRHLAGEVHRTRTRAEILSLKSVAARVSAWMACNGGVLPPKGRWHHVASEIAVTPEAFYRELARQR
ncbi:Crp/Fnr family transcriptional regulator [Mesorhizobium sp.]|uniref:Crp/Fnr family transcriptional regulator n=1 Tax=Mesorhizobium sp. TaxID=1871066 RepID=UPI000FE8200B|nr:Crp/Fnr family transcriptional regulator [Mesorhizobium sp.]RWI29419.1 MAG: Crp/Fnr family transcriptional regulator [Mesorhizobium sp.]RWK52381.1 MAG: Crp/Fnr family transcriptional regulator [Mesorhizobium sp.]RWK97443.1 MAG: Crp/Fnr family transcriptional regulator [Mesorhizobium sp.]RWL02490.1 MAG: Crp/Fnr family transcriptional regulator [Mesorhizobium sp.]TIP58830.1 MAG: Crp/Fnr family transcriptional regulator [Mesorhizobium sp.]